MYQNWSLQSHYWRWQDYWQDFEWEPILPTS